MVCHQSENLGFLLGKQITALQTPAHLKAVGMLPRAQFGPEFHLFTGSFIFVTTKKHFSLFTFF